MRWLLFALLLAASAWLAPSPRATGSVVGADPSPAYAAPACGEAFDSGFIVAVPHPIADPGFVGDDPYVPPTTACSPAIREGGNGAAGAP